MINWEQINELHVTRKFRTIYGRWWGVDIFFADERGHLKGIKQQNQKWKWENPLCAVYFEKESNVEKFQDFVYELNDGLKGKNDTPLLREIFPGCFSYTCPIKFSNEFMGSVTTCFFYTDATTSHHTEKLVRSLVSSGFNEAQAQEVVGKLKSLDIANQHHLSDLTELLVQEIVGFYNEIASRDQKISELNSQLTNRYNYHSMIGKSKPMQEIYSLLDKISRSESTCLITGESGTGKELIAKAIHYHSNRKDKVIVVQNCSAFNDNLLDSELFGHAKGSFTGAIRDKKGLFEVANGGTLFLDEIGDTSLSMQVKLLRVLQEGTFNPVGGNETKHVDVRILAATNKNLTELVAKGEFREDLYYRINVINISLPSLKERKEDILLLVEHFLEKYSKERNLPKKSFSKKAMELMLEFHWPGNIRQLENEVERATVLAGDEITIGQEMLSKPIRESIKVEGANNAANNSGNTVGQAMHSAILSGKLKDAMEELEKEMILEGLKRNNWNKSKLAKDLGVSRASLIMKVEKYGLDRRRIARV